MWLRGYVGWRSRLRLLVWVSGVGKCCQAAGYQEWGKAAGFCSWEPRRTWWCALQLRWEIFRDLSCLGTIISALEPRAYADVGWRWTCSLAAGQITERILQKGIKSVQWSLFFLCMWSLLSWGSSIVSTSLCPNRPLHERSPNTGTHQSLTSNAWQKTKVGPTSSFLQGGGGGSLIISAL